MATEKNNKTNESLKYIEVLNNFRNEESINFSEFLLNKDMYEIVSIIDETLLVFDILKNKAKDEVDYEVNKQLAIFFYGLLQCTSLKVEKEDISLDNYDLKFEQEILNRSIAAKKIKEMLENIIKKRELQVIEMLTEEFKNIPDDNELDKIQAKIDRMFSNRSSEDLKMIQNILEFNDPTLKAIKKALTIPNGKEVKIGELTKNGDNITKR